MKFIATALLIFLSNQTYAQYPDLKRTSHWFFGDHCGLDFSGGATVADTNGSLNTMEGCAAISDTSGNLLFYTDGILVWDSTHTQMPNGFGLHGDYSSLNSALIIPQPGSDNIYYIFTTPAYAGHWTGDSAFEYSVVDMNLNAGLGDVATKNVALFPTAIEQLGAVHHKNKTDYWVVAHEAFTSNFMAYLVTSAGVSPTPVVSNTGFQNGGYTPVCWGCAVSGLKFSPSGCRLACTYPNSDTLQLFEFDNSSGTVMNPVTINIGYPWDACFSPDNNLLYVNSTSAGNLLQYNLSSYTQAAIMASQINITGASVGTMQNGSDGKIYCTGPQHDYLAVINNPNTTGMACNFVDTGLYLGGKQSISGLTNFVQSYFVNDTILYQCAAVGIEESIFENSVDIFPNPFSSCFTITLHQQNATQLSLTIVNTLGQQVFNLQEKNSDYSIARRIDMREFANGIYLVAVTIDGKRITRKIIKQ